MNKHTDNLDDNFRPKDLADVTVRLGIAKDKFIFITICLVAILVATLTLFSQLNSSKARAATSTWECLDCGYQFNVKTFELSPIECPKCTGQAVMLHYRVCPECREEILLCRTRMTKEFQAQYAVLKAQAKDRDATQTGMLPGLPLIIPMEGQYRLRQPDGSYDWSDWIRTNSLQAIRIKKNLNCPKCGALVK